MPTWLWIVAAIVQTGIDVAQWFLWLKWKDIERLYPPEVFAAAHVTAPRGLLFTAIFSAVIAAALWLRAYWSAERWSDQ